MSRTVTICFSGGVDSTALIQYYSDIGFEIRCTHFDYGQPAYYGEERAVRKLSSYYGVETESSPLQPFILQSDSGEFFSRNLLLVLSAINLFNLRNGLISLGIHYGTSYYDCSKEFVANTQQLLDVYFGGAIVLDTPFINFSKADIFQYCDVTKAPVGLTYSCEVDGSNPCGKCPSCLDRNRYYARKRSLST